MQHQKSIELIQKLMDLRTDQWLNETLFSLSWWVLCIVVLSALLVWLILLDKSRAMEIITYGLMVTITGTFGDVIGVLLQLWQYPNALTPLPTLASIHVIIMPIIYMIIYQYFGSWKQFLIAVTINAFVFAFILEPILTWLNIYELIQYKHIYSFIPYIVIAVVFKWGINQLKQWDQNYSKNQKSDD